MKPTERILIGLAVGLGLAVVGFLFIKLPLRDIIDPKQYEAIIEQSLTAPKSGERFSIIGYQAKDLLSKSDLLSYLAVYKNGPNGKELVYRFSPAVPAAANYPRPLVLEKAALIANKAGQLFIVSSWGETGADYWGTHPVVIAYQGGQFKAVNIYAGKLADVPRLKAISWTQKDIEVTNRFARPEKVRTILTQGTESRPAGAIELRFFGDDKPKAGAHKFITIKLPLKAIE